MIKQLKQKRSQVLDEMLETLWKPITIFIEMMIIVLELTLILDWELGLARLVILIAGSTTFLVWGFPFFARLDTIGSAIEHEKMLNEETGGNVIQFPLERAAK